MCRTTFFCTKLAKTLPFASVPTSSGFPPRSNAPTTLPSLESTTVALWLLRLKVKTRFVAGSKTVGPGLSPVDFTCPMVSSVFVLKIVSRAAPPLLIKPRSSSGSITVNTGRVVDLSHELSGVDIDHDHVRAMRYLESWTSFAFWYWHGQLEVAYRHGISARRSLLFRRLDVSKRKQEREVVDDLQHA